MKYPDIDYEYGKNIFENGFEKFSYWDVFALAQYLYWELEYKERRIIKYLINFSEKYDKNFNLVLSRKAIQSAMKSAIKIKPQSDVDVVITQYEIEKIKTVKNYKFQKLLFAMIVSAKREKFDTIYPKNKKTFLGYSISHKNTHKFCRELQIKVSIKNVPMLLHQFVLLGLLDASRNQKAKIMFANDNSKPAVKVLANDNPIEKYISENGGEIIYCEKCGLPTPKTSNRQKFCKDCQKIIRKEKVRVNVGNFRKKTSVITI